MSECNCNALNCPNCMAKADVKLVIETNSWLQVDLKCPDCGEYWSGDFKLKEKGEKIKSLYD